MNLIDFLNSNQTKVRCLVFNDQGYAADMKTGRIQSSVTHSGPDLPSSKVLSLVHGLKIPTAVLPPNKKVDSHKMLYDLLPMTASEFKDDMREGAIGSSSHVSFEVYANIAMRLQGNCFNVKQMAFIPEMFAKTGPYDFLCTEMTRSPDQKKRPGEVSPSWSIPLDENLNSFAGFLDKIKRERAAEDKRAILELQEMYKFSANDPKHSQYFERHLVAKTMAINILHLANIITWNALMVKANNLTQEGAWQEIANFVGKIQKELEQRTEDHPIEDYAYLHEAAEAFKKITMSTEMVVSAALRSINEPPTSEMDAPSFR